MDKEAELTGIISDLCDSLKDLGAGDDNAFYYDGQWWTPNDWLGDAYDED